MVSETRGPEGEERMADETTWVESGGLVARARRVPGARAFEVTLVDASRNATVSAGSFVDGLRSSVAMRRVLGEVIVRSGFEAVFFEVMPLRADRLDEPLAFVILDAPGLCRTGADPSAFEDRFAGQLDDIIVFDNLGGDATLVVPRPMSPSDTGAHLASFVRGAPPERVDALWRTVGEALDRRLRADEAPVWLSTSGLGVPWLHVRLDRRPKYYVHAPFRALPA